MNFWKILIGEEPGIIESIKNYENLGQFGEYLTEYALTNHNITGQFVVLKNLYIPHNNKTTEIDLLMIHEKGIFVFESKNYSGWIFGDINDLNWTQCLKGGQKNHFYNPVRQNKTHINALSNYLNLPKNAFISYIIFSERCELKNIPENTDNIIIVKRPNMLKHIRHKLKVSPIIYSLENIKRIEMDLNMLPKKESIAEQHIIEIQNKCPFCGAKLVQRNGKNGFFYGCSSFPKCRYTRSI